MPLNIDPSAPTKDEIEAHQRKVAAHNLKIAKANLASSLCEKLCGNSGLDFERLGANGVANFAIAVAEHIMETYSLMPDAAGNKGGLVS